MKLLIHYQTSLVKPLKFGNGYVILSHTLLNMWLLIHPGIKLGFGIKNHAHLYFIFQGAPRRKSQALRTSLQDPFTIKISFEEWVSEDNPSVRKKKICSIFLIHVVSLLSNHPHGRTMDLSILGRIACYNGIQLSIVNNFMLFIFFAAINSSWSALLKIERFVYILSSALNGGQKLLGI